jgi:hypothetical protein
MTMLINNWVSNTTDATNWAGTGHPSRAQDFSSFQWNFFVLPNLQCISLSTIVCHFINLALTIALFVFFLFTAIYWTFNIFKFSLHYFNWPLPVITDLYVTQLSFKCQKWPLPVRTDLYVIQLTFPPSWLIITAFVTILTRWVLLVEQELLPLPEHVSSPPVFSGVGLTRFLVLWACFVDRRLTFWLFAFGYCVVCSSIYGYWLPLWYLQTLLIITDL